MNLRDQHYNRCLPRQRQGEHRAAKIGYRPTGLRAPHDQPAKPKAD